MSGTMQSHAADRYFDANGLCLHTRTWTSEGSTARPLVILHGMDESWRTFGRLAPRFAQTRPVYAVDLRGHGDSDAPATGYRLTDYTTDILELVPQIGGNIDLLGHSLGSMIAMLVAREMPDTVTHLVLEDPPIVLPGDEAVLRQIANLSGAMTRRQSLPAAIETLTPVFASYPSEWVEMNARDILGTAIGSWDGLMDWEQDRIAWEVLLPAISAPTLVLAPRPNATEGWFAGERRTLVERLLPSARIVTFPVNAHHVSVHAPEAYIEAVDSFLRDS